MINWLHSKFHDPRGSWDPIPLPFAKRYGEGLVAAPEVVNLLETALGGLQGKRVVDIGSGPGHYSLEFARRGAKVTCVDVSKNYFSIAKSKLRSAGFDAEFIVGYMDRVETITAGGFDAVFGNVSWNYCFNDYTFAKSLLNAAKVGGVVVIRTTNENYMLPHRGVRRIVYWLNRHLNLKIGHPHPPPGRIESAFREVGGTIVSTDYSDPKVDIVVAMRSQ